MKYKEMERKNNGIIYGIVSISTGFQYIGSTCKKLSHKMSRHVSVFNKFLKNGNDVKLKYVLAFDIIKNHEYDRFIIERLDNNLSKQEIKEKLDYYIEKMDCVNKTCHYENAQDWVNANSDYIENHNNLHKKIFDYKEKNNQNISYKKYECPCGGKYLYIQRNYHYKTIKHQKYLNELEKKEE